MKAKPANPFLVSGYQGPGFFCDREDETGQLVTALANGRNVCLTSPRRMGKTGLILHLFNRLNAEDPAAKCFYIDIFATQSLHDFTAALAHVVVGQLDDYSDAAIRRIGSFFKSSFLAKHALGAASSVRQALKALEDKALVLRGNAGGYFIYDRFFGLWLSQKADFRGSGSVPTMGGG